MKNSEFVDGRHWRNGEAKLNSKRNSYENESERRILDTFETRAKKLHSSDTEASRKNSEMEMDRRRHHNGGEVYSSGRRPRQNGIESHKIIQKQIENVIDAILEDSKNPDFQVKGLTLLFCK